MVCNFKLGDLIIGFFTIKTITNAIQANENRPALICSGCKLSPNQSWPKLFAKIIVPAIKIVASTIRNAAWLFGSKHFIIYS